MRTRTAAVALIATAALMVGPAAVAVAGTTSLPAVSAQDLGMPMVQRLDLGGVMVMVPPGELAPLAALPGPVLGGANPPTAKPTPGPRAAGGSAPRPSPGPRLPDVLPGGSPPPRTGLGGPLDRGAPLVAGVPVLYTVLSGPTAQLAAIDPANGEAYGSPVALPGIQGSWSLVQGKDGDIYIGGYEGGDLYRYDPATGVATNLGNPTGDSYIFSLSVDPVTGLIWAGTWPGGKIYSYDPATGAFSAPVAVAAGETYARSVAAYDGHVYVGLGDRTAELVDYDARTGQVTQMPLPARNQGAAGTVGTVQVVAPGRLYAQFLGGLLYSIPDDHLVSTFGEPSGSGVSLESLGPTLFFTQRDATPGTPQYGEGWIQTYNMLTNREGVYTSATASYAPYLWGDQPHETWLVDLHDPSYPGISLVTLDARAHLTIFDLADGAFAYFTLTNLPGQPETIETLGPGAAGTSDLMGSGYLQGDTFTYDPTTGTSTEHEGPGQAESIAGTGGDVFLGTYPGGKIWRYDPSQPWAFGPSPLLQRNPSPVTTLGHNQIRPFVLAPDSEGNLVVGSVPSYGNFGGLLETIDPSSGATTALFPLPAPMTAQSPTAAAAVGPGGVEVGTTVSSGSVGTPPDPPSLDPGLFTYDPTSATVPAGSVLTAPFDGQWAIDGLAWDAGTGLVYGLTPTFVFAYDPVTGTVTATQPIAQATPVPASTSADYYDWGHTSGLVLGSNGYLYALVARAGGAILEIDPHTLAYAVVATGADRIGSDASGDVYYAVGHELWRLTPQA